MKKWLFLTHAALLFFSVNAQEEDRIDDYEIEEEMCNEELCRPPEKRAYIRRYYCPNRYCDFYDYEDRDIDATWPGKMENSFMEELMR